MVSISEELKTQVGQRLILSFKGAALTDEVARLIVDCRIGGIILFRSHGNIESLRQVRQLNRDLQQLAASNNLPPLIISIDEEGGRVSRMPPDGAALAAPSQMAQAAAGGNAVEVAAASTARRLRSLGFNLNYAPVLDVNNNPANPVIGTRSFGSNPQEVAEHGAAAIGAYLAENFASCVKHFPGHGDTNVDSHLGLPVVHKSIEQLRTLELLPFVRAVQAGAPAFMTAHITYPEIEPQNLPATLSPFFLGDNGLLRRELGFQGLIFTDALIMDAIYKTYKLEQSSVLALQAGADIVMPLGDERTCYEAMLEAAARGDYQVEASAARLRAFKNRFCQPPLAGQEDAAFEAALEGEAGLMEAVARRSITLVRNRHDLLPLTPGKFQRPLLIDFESELLSPVEDGRLKTLPRLADLLAPGLPQLASQRLPASFDNQAATDLVAMGRESDALVIVARNATRLPNQRQLITHLVELGLPTVLIAARDPYDLALFDADALLATYSDPLCSILAVAAVLTGEVKATGHLPIAI